MELDTLESALPASLSQMLLLTRGAEVDGLKPQPRAPVRETMRPGLLPRTNELLCRMENHDTGESRALGAPYTLPAR